MSLYNHILFAIDLHPDCDNTLARKAKDIAAHYGAKLSVVHAIENLNSYGAAFIYPAIAEVESQLTDAAGKEMTKLCQAEGIAEENAVIEVGPPRSVISDVAAREKVDLILVGSHGRHGLQRLIGSTAAGLLHDAPCDVLVIRVQD